MAVVLSLDAWISLRKETALLEADMHSDERYTGGALASAFTQTWRLEGEARAVQLLDGMNSTSHGPTVRWVDPLAAKGTRDAPARDEARARIAARETFSLLDRAAPEGGRLYTYVPVHVEGGPQGAVELSESLKDEHDHLRGLVLQRIVTTSGIAVLSTVLAGILGAWIVGRPMHALVAKARRVGTGDLSGPLAMKQHDEIGE